MSTVNLQKGERVKLEKANDSGNKVTHLEVGLGWSANTGDGADFDLDASVFCLNAEGKTSVPYFLYYGSPQVDNKPTILEGALIHSGDNLTGDGDGDDETVYIDLNKVPSDTVKMVVVVSIHEAGARNQSFSMVQDAYVDIKNPKNNSEVLFHFDLSWDATGAKTVKFVEIFKVGDEWAVSALNTEIDGELGAVCSEYGLTPA